jgi:hypothetical protein
LCDPFTTLSATAEGFRADDIGVAETCFEIVDYVPDNNDAPSLVCWNFDTGRSLELNGEPIECKTSGVEFTIDERAGGYCLKAGAGPFSYAGILFPL